MISLAFFYDQNGIRTAFYPNVFFYSEKNIIKVLTKSLLCITI